MGYQKLRSNNNSGILSGITVPRNSRLLNMLMLSLSRVIAVIVFILALYASPGLAQQQDPFAIDRAPVFRSSAEPKKFCLFPVAHCYCELNSGTSFGKVIQKLGWVSEYCGQGLGNQISCENDCNNYVSGWAASNKTQACTDFYYGSPSLLVYSALGTHGYDWTGGWLDGTVVNYPLGCGPSSSILVPYIVTDVIYAPPGCTPDNSSNGYNCQPVSTVSYTGSSAGSMQLSIEDSLAHGDSLTVNDRATTVGNVIPLSQSFTAGYTATISRGAGFSVSKTSSYSETWGTNKSVPLSNDGFNHDQDLVKTLLDAGAVFVSWQNPFQSQQIVAWAPGHNASAPVIIQPFTISELRCGVLNYPSHTIIEHLQNQHYRALVTLHDSKTGAVIPCQSMEANLYHHLIAPRSQGGLGFTIRDFYQILAADEYWGSAYNPITSVDKTRYTLEKTLSAFAYDSAVNLGGSNWQCPTALTQGVSNQNVESGSLKAEYKYTTNYMVSAGKPAFLSDKNTMTWTTTVSDQNTGTSTKGVTAQVGCGSVNWGHSPSNFLFVYPYFDALFGDFLFAGGDFTPPQEKPYYSGLVIDSSGKALSQVKLELSFDGKTFDAFSDKDGQFHFYNYSGKELDDSVAAELSIPAPNGTIIQTVTLGGASTVLLPPDLLGNMEGAREER